MVIIQNLNRWMLLWGASLLILVSSPVAALEKTALNALTHESVWILNIDGFDYKIQLYGQDQKTGSSGWLRRGVASEYGKGLLHLNWRGRQATLDINVPISNGRQLKCNGIPARNLSFVSGKCDADLPFVMTPQKDPNNSENQFKNCERSKQALRTNNATSRDILNRCQKALRIAYQELNEPTSKARLDTRDITQNASRNLPYSRGANCAKCDSAPKLDVPQNPKNNTQESRWLIDLLNAQNQAITQLFGASDQSQVKTQEQRVCEGKQKCFALFRQNVITAAAREIGKSQ